VIIGWCFHQSSVAGFGRLLLLVDDLKNNASGFEGVSNPAKGRSLIELSSLWGVIFSMESYLLYGELSSLWGVTFSMGHEGAIRNCPNDTHSGEH